MEIQPNLPNCYSTKDSHGVKYLKLHDISVTEAPSRARWSFPARHSRQCSVTKEMIMQKFCRH